MYDVVKLRLFGGKIGRCILLFYVTLHFNDMFLAAVAQCNKSRYGSTKSTLTVTVLRLKWKATYF